MADQSQDHSPQVRDSQLRASLIMHAHLAGDRSESGWTTASKLAIAARDEHRHGVESEGHAGRLIDELIELGLLAEKRANEPGLPTAGAVRELRHRLVRLTDKGRDFYWGRLEPIPGVDHWRHA